jgi:hypothetical protein
MNVRTMHIAGRVEYTINKIRLQAELLLRGRGSSMLDRCGSIFWNNYPEMYVSSVLDMFKAVC